MCSVLCLVHNCGSSSNYLFPELQFVSDDKQHFSWFCTTVWIHIQLWKSLAPSFSQNCVGVHFRKTQRALARERNELSWINWAAKNKWVTRCLISLLVQQKDLLLSAGVGLCKLRESKVFFRACAIFSDLIQKFWLLEVWWVKELDVSLYREQTLYPTSNSSENWNI